MYIGQASKESGASIKAIRYYEELGFLPNVLRKGNYRIFSSDDVQIIKFIQTAQTLGFKLAELVDVVTQDNGVSNWYNIEKLVREKQQRINDEISELKKQQKQLVNYEQTIKQCLSSKPNCTFPQPDK